MENKHRNKSRKALGAVDIATFVVLNKKISQGIGQIENNLFFIQSLRRTILYGVLGDKKGS